MESDQDLHEPQPTDGLSNTVEEDGKDVVGCHCTDTCISVFDDYLFLHKYLCASLFEAIFHWVRSRVQIAKPMFMCCLNMGLAKICQCHCNMRSCFL